MLSLSQNIFYIRIFFKLEVCFEMIKGVIFDMDGTLIDSTAVWDKVIEESVARFGVIPNDRDYELMDPMSQAQVLEYLCKQYPQIDLTPAELSFEMDEIVIERYKKVSHIRHGAIEFMQKLKKMDIKMSLATLTAKRQAEKVISHHGLDEYLSYIITVDEVGKSKENPDIYLKAAQYMGVNPCECLVCEDAPYAVQSAKNGGFMVCGISERWYEKKREQLICNSDVVIENSFDELLDFFYDNV